MPKHYEITVGRFSSHANVRVDGPAGRFTAAKVYYANLDALGGPQRASVSWPSIGAQEPAVAETVGQAIQTAARIAADSDEQPLGFSPRYAGGDVTEHYRVDTEQARQLAAEHEAKGKDEATREEGRSGLYWVYGNSARWDWELGEPVYSLGLGARVLRRVPESAISPVEVSA